MFSCTRHTSIAPIGTPQYHKPINKVNASGLFFLFYYTSISGNCNKFNDGIERIKKKKMNKRRKNTTQRFKSTECV